MTLSEVVIASFLVVLVMTGVASTLSIASRLQQAVTLQSDTSDSAATAMNRITLDVREAKEVQELSATRFRVYRPVVLASGRYDRFMTDYSRYVEYALTTASGTPSATGTYLWRKSESDTGRPVARNVALLAVSSPSASSMRISLSLSKSSGNRTGRTDITERVLYLRNN